MIKNAILILALCTASINFSMAANEQNTLQSVEKKDIADTNKGSTVDDVIQEYKNYLATIEPSLREEIIKYRKEIAELNKQKRELYRKLSKEAQNYLKEEQKYKRRLPMDQKKLVTPDQSK